VRIVTFGVTKWAGGRGRLFLVVDLKILNKRGGIAESIIRTRQHTTPARIGIPKNNAVKSNFLKGDKMKAKKYWVLAAILGICANIIWATNKTDSQTFPQATFLLGRDTMKGLQGVRVLLSLDPVVYGLTEQQLQTDVELRLRQNGIRVFSEQEWLSTLEHPCLIVKVNPMMNIDGEGEITGFVSYYISLGLHQSVFLARDTTKLCVAETWNSVLMGSVALHKIEIIRENVKDEIDGFINNYLAANPKAIDEAKP
jgi:hypothetical protein